MNVTSNIRWRTARYRRIAAMLLCLLPALAPAAEAAETLLTISQKGSVLGTFSLAALEATGAVAVTVEDDSGQSSEYTGVPIAQLLESVGVSLGKSVRGERLSEFVMVRAADGYRVLFSLAETDPIFRERPVLLCYRKNGGSTGRPGRAPAAGRRRRKATRPLGEAGHGNRIGQNRGTAAGTMIGKS